MANEPAEAPTDGEAASAETAVIGATDDGPTVTDSTAAATTTGPTIAGTPGDTTDREPASGPGRSERAAAWVFGGAVAVSFPLLLNLGSFFWFFRDDWFFITERELSSGHDLIAPHNDHWVTFPVVVFRLLFGVFGVRTYVPYQAAVVLLHLAVVVLLRMVMRRSGVGPWLATATAGSLLLFGPGREDILWAFQIGFTGAVAFGLTQLLLADHDGPVDRRDALALVAGLLAIMSTATGVAMVIVVGLAILLRRGWRAAAVQTVPLAVIFGLWSAIEGVGSSGPFGRPTIGVMARWVRSGHIGTFLGLGHYPVVAGLLAALLVVGIGLALALPHPGEVAGVSLLRHLLDRLRMIALPVALLVGSAVFMVLSSQARWFIGPQGARAGRYLYLGAAFTLPALAVAAQALGRVWRPASATIVVLLAVAVPANVAAFDAQPFGPAYHESRRQVLTYAVRMPQARNVDPSVRPIPDPYLSPGLDMGFLLWAADNGKLHVPDGPVPPAIANELNVRLGLAQSAPDGLPGGCRWIEGAQQLTVAEGDQFILQGPITVRPVNKGSVARLAVPIDPRQGSLLTAQVDDLTVALASGDPKAPLRVCEVLGW